MENIIGSLSALTGAAVSIGVHYRLFSDHLPLQPSAGRGRAWIDPLFLWSSLSDDLELTFAPRRRPAI